MLLRSCRRHHCWPPGRPAEVCPLHSAPHPRSPQFLNQCLLNECVSLGSKGKGLGGKEGGRVSKTPEKIHFKDRVLTPHSFTGQPSLGQGRLRTGVPRAREKPHSSRSLQKADTLELCSCEELGCSSRSGAELSWDTFDKHPLATPVSNLTSW